MSEMTNPSRRRVLGFAAAFLAGVGATLAALPFIRSLRNVGPPPPPVDVDLTKMVDGQLVAVESQLRPIYILKRGQETLRKLSAPNPELADPLSLESAQPVDAQNTWRSVRPDILVVDAVCTHLDCTVGLVPAGIVEGLPDGGFLCPCHGAAYDLAGRVLRGGPAPLNLPVPAHRFVDANTLRLDGDDL